MRWTLSVVDGFSVSSLFEARLANAVLAGQGSIHLTTPGLRAAELPELLRLCSHISFNSLSHWQRYAPLTQSDTSLGLRVNPQLSFATDARFDPCRAHSKLGVALQSLASQGLPPHVEGLHVHTMFNATEYKPLVQSVAALRAALGKQFTQLRWINLGGGYLFNAIADHQAFISLVKQLRADFNLAVYIEPGKAVLEQTGYLVSTVVDRFDSEGKTVLVLDTSVNHHPEVFEYQRQLPVLEHCPAGTFQAQLVGSSCLAGDVFGDYRFTTPLDIGARVTFCNVGAYSLIKASRFNGYPLPAVYSFLGEQLTPISQDSYAAYQQQWCV
jgi:carboxynorspermidine decarboxylase